MVYEVKAVRVNDDGTREDCVLTIHYNSQYHCTPMQSQTMIQALEDARRTLQDRAIEIGFEFKDDWTGEPSIFFTTRLRRDFCPRSELLKSTRVIEASLRAIAYKFLPERHAYFNYQSEDDLKQGSGSFLTCTTMWGIGK